MTLDVFIPNTKNLSAKTPVKSRVLSNRFFIHPTQQGLNALQILRRFYPNDIQIVETDNIGGVQESFPGFTLRPGMSDPSIRTLQTWLNRIRANFPAIPPVTVSGVYGPQTEAAVRAFQSIRSLGTVTPNGIVDRATWWNISRAFSAIKRLGELTSEGIVVGIGRTPPTDIIRQGARGTLVGRAQYMINFISEFYPGVPSVVEDFNFGPAFSAAVQEFQRLFGLNPDGVIGPLTWRRLYEVYWGIRDNVNLPGEGGTVVPPLPPGPPPGPEGIPPYPGQPIRVGARGDDVQRIQRCLNSVNNAGLNADGIFGPLTQNAVMNFQRSRGLNPDGVVGPLTWGALMPACYGNNQTMSAYPGFLIREGARSDYVQQIQTCLNRVNNAGLNTDGVFGPLTRAAVVNYQRANGLTPDGIVGPLTWNHLRERCGSAVRATSLSARVDGMTEDIPEFEALNNFPLSGTEPIQAEAKLAPDMEDECDAPIDITDNTIDTIPVVPAPPVEPPPNISFAPIPPIEKPSDMPTLPDESHSVVPVMPISLGEPHPIASSAPPMEPLPIQPIEPIPVIPSIPAPPAQQRPSSRFDRDGLFLCIAIYCLCRHR